MCSHIGYEGGLLGFRPRLLSLIKTIPFSVFLMVNRTIIDKAMSSSVASNVA